MANILVCEDDASTRGVIVAMLQKLGHTLFQAENGALGWALIETQTFDLILSDIEMPEMSGIELLRQVRSTPAMAFVPFVLLTSHSEPAQMRLAITSGANDFVSKPCKIRELVDSVNAQLEKALFAKANQVAVLANAVDTAVAKRTSELVNLYDKRLERELRARWNRTDAVNTDLNGIMVAISLSDQMLWQEALTPLEWADWMGLFLSKIGDSATLFNADLVQFLGDGLLVVFDEKSDTPTVSHVERAVRFLRASMAVRAAMLPASRERFAGRGLPHFAYTVVLHRGQVVLAKVAGAAGGVDQWVPVGSVVAELAAFKRSAQDLRWPMAMSDKVSPKLVKHTKSVDRAETRMPSLTEVAMLFKAELMQA